MITCKNCEQILLVYLCDIPYQWRKQIANAICGAFPSSDFTCEDVAKCETLTTLSEFTQIGSRISIVFTDERNKKYTLEIDIKDVLNVSLDNIDPMCLASPEDWAIWTNKQRIESIINSSCNC